VLGINFAKFKANIEKQADLITSVNEYKKKLTFALGWDCFSVFISTMILFFGIWLSQMILNFFFPEVINAMILNRFSLGTIFSLLYSIWSVITILLMLFFYIKPFKVLNNNFNGNKNVQ
jgi:hypothetical protein